MVTFDTHCGLGNQLFQYALARCLADRFNFRLAHGSHMQRPWRHSGASYCLPDVFDLDLNPDGIVATGPVQFIGPAHRVDLDALDPTLPIHCVGYYERFKQIEPWSEQLREHWIRPREIPHPPVPSEVIGMHFRIGDQEQLGWNLSPDYYLEARALLGEGETVIVTDSPGHDHILEILSQLDGSSVRCTTFESDFAFLLHCRRLIISNSTFSWWAAWLGQAREIISTGQNCSRFGGAWHERYRCTQGQDVDYWPQEKRYRYLE